MILAVLAGSAAGAVHAVAGPDHVLGLAPFALGRRRAWRLGLLWGLGHGAGSLLCAALLLAFVAVADLPVLDRWGELVAGVALVWMGLAGLRRRLDASLGAEARGAFLVGLVHGATGASALLLMLPAVAAASAAETGGYLAGFVVGSTAAMAAITGSLSRFAAGGAGRWSARLGRLASFGSLALGGFWILRGVA